EIVFDTPSLVVTIIATFLSAIVCGSAPAWRFSKADPVDILHNAGRTATAGQAAQRLRSDLVAIESALCVVLTIVAGLLIHSFIRITALDQGFRTQNIVTTGIQLYGQRYNTPASRDVFFKQVTEAIQALPGTQSVGMVSSLPLTGQTNI